MSLKEKFKTNKFFIFASIFALLNMGAIFIIFGFKKYSDSLTDIDLIHWLLGLGGRAAPERILRPLGPILAAPFEFLGDGAGLIVQNIIFYLLCAFLVFKIVDLIYHNKKQAFFASLFFVSATPVIESGLAYLTDMGAWFFYIFSIFLTLLYFKNKNEKLIILNGFLSGIGVLMKENGGLGVLFFGLMILFSCEFSIKEKISKIMRFGIFFLIPILTLQFLMYKYFHFTSLDWYLGNLPGSSGDGLLLTSLRYFGQLFRVLGVLWIFFFIGVFQEWREKNWERIKIYLALLPSSFSFLLWTVGAAGRGVFIFAPLGILLASYGCKKIGVIQTVLLILTILAINYSFCWLNPTIPFVDRLVEFIF
ncbi:MAG: glycosyltransferase family 39 protein [Candidatus Nealsonbacteria bacterium]